MKELLLEDRDEKMWYLAEMWHELRSFDKISKLEILKPAWLAMVAQYHLLEKANTMLHTHRPP